MLYFAAVSSLLIIEDTIALIVAVAHRVVWYECGCSTPTSKECFQFGARCLNSTAPKKFYEAKKKKQEKNIKDYITVSKIAA